MITARTIQRFCSAALILGGVAAFFVSFYFDYWNVMVVALVVALLIFATSFVMELYHVSISDPVLWLIARFQSRKDTQKIEKDDAA